LVEPDSALIPFFEAIQKAAGVRLGQDIWRFKLPPFPSPSLPFPPLPSPSEEKQFCLTGNNVLMEGNEPRSENNSATGGTYTYSRFPTGDPDQGKEGESLPFTQGHLTDRLTAYTTRERNPASPPGGDLPARWIVSWTDQEPVAITFDLKEDYPLRRIRFFYSGRLPAVSVQGSRDGLAWEDLAATAGQPFTEDVVDVELSLHGDYRYVRLQLAARQEARKLELAEVEIWGTEVG
jgi:hypothetical protein